MGCKVQGSRFGCGEQMFEIVSVFAKLDVLITNILRQILFMATVSLLCLRRNTLSNFV